MGFLGKVVSGLGNIIKPLAQTAIKAIAPKAIDTLKNIVGSGFDSLVGKAKDLVGKLPLVGPLAAGLVDKYAPQLKNLGLGALEKGLGSLVEKFTGTSIGGQNVVPGTIAQRATAAASAAATALAPSTASASAAATALNIGSGNSAVNNALGVMGGFSANSTPTADKAIAASGLDPNSQEAKMMRAQEMVQNQARAFQMISQLLQMQHDGQKGIIQNIRA